MDWIFVRSTAAGKAGYGSVTARIRNHGQNRKYAIGYCIKETEWDKIRSMRYIGSNTMRSACMKYAQFACLLGRLKVAIENNIHKPQLIPSIIRSVKAETVIGEDVATPDNSVNDSMLLSDCIARYREDMRTGRRLKRKKSVKVSEGYIGNISSALTTLLLYEKVCQRKITLDSATLEFSRSFVAFMRYKGLKSNTIHTRMSVIHVVMQAAYTEKLTRNDDFRDPEFVPSQEETDTIFLSSPQIEQLLTMDLSSVDAVKSLYAKAGFNNKSLSRVPRPDKRMVKYLEFSRDIFVIGCLTGQRYSDYTRICSDMVITLEKSEFIALHQVKTGTKVLIPVDNRVVTILTKYGGRLPYVSKLTFGRNIKLLGELSGWTYRPEFDKPKSQYLKERFCDLITTHTARRSFATNAYAAGVPLSSIMAVTGHSSEKNLRKYLKLQAEDKAVIAGKDFEGFIQTKTMKCGKVQQVAVR